MLEVAKVLSLLLLLLLQLDVSVPLLLHHLRRLLGSHVAPHLRGLPTHLHGLLRLRGHDLTLTHLAWLTWLLLHSRLRLLTRLTLSLSLSLLPLLDEGRHKTRIALEYAHDLRLLLL